MEQDIAIKAAIVGLGNLAWSLIPNLQQAGVDIQQVLSRNPDTVNAYRKAWQIQEGSTSLDDLHTDLDWVFLTVGDDAIGEVVRQLTKRNHGPAMFVHTSGSTSMEVLAPLGERIGVFYPMQTFTKDRVVDFEEIPVFLEGDRKVMPSLKGLASKLSSRVYELDSPGRMRLHIGAVLACNFTNYLYRIAVEQLPEGPAWDFRIYEPLVREHLEKVFQFLPHQTQTGPAIRGDQKTISKHIQHLENEPDIQVLYEMLSRLINPDM